MFHNQASNLYSLCQDLGISALNHAYISDIVFSFHVWWLDSILFSQAPFYLPLVVVLRFILYVHFLDDFINLMNLNAMCMLHVICLVQM